MPLTHRDNGVSMGGSLKEVSVHLNDLKAVGVVGVVVVGIVVIGVYEFILPFGSAEMFQIC
jgi:hypothetical protein